MPDTFMREFSSSTRDPNPWLAMYVDQSLPLPNHVKAALLRGLASRSRQFLLPIVRPIARLSIVLIQVIRIFLPNAFSSSRFLHYLIYLGLKYFVSPGANMLILRHFCIGSEIQKFIRDNAGLNSEVELNPLKPTKLEEVKKDLFLIHDLNLYNFIINLNAALQNENKELECRKTLDFSSISSEPIQFETFPNHWHNFVDVETAIEIYTPLYQLFLTDNDFWRATNSLQLDETIGIYISRILGKSESLWLINNKHPLVPLATLRAGYRLMLHGVASETLHGLLVKMKKESGSL